MTNNAAPSPSPSPHPRSQLTTRALVVWVGAVLFYIVGVTGRTSFGVAGVDAIERFGVDASRIAVFTSVQVGVYALAQIPTGLLIDRFGPKRVLITGAVVMGIGQVILGLTTNYWVAILARVLIGAGDATAFLSVMRILPYWFPAKWTPLFTQLTSSTGQLGQFISAVPFLALLNAQGWQVAFVSLGAVGVLIAIAAGIAVSDAPDGDAAQEQQDKVEKLEADDAAGRKRETVWDRLRAVLGTPVGWQAFFIHYSGMLFQIVFTLLWGVPMMTLGMGLSSIQVGVVLTINTISNIVAAPLLGVISQRMGTDRGKAALAFTALIGIAWAIFLFPEQPRSMAAVIMVNIVMALFTPTANFGFDNVRQMVPRKNVATATGLGNMGGFLSAMVAAQLVGVFLDMSSGGEGYEWGDFRVAWLAVFGVWLIGMTGAATAQIMVSRRRRGRSDVRVVDEEPER